jgi:Mrp family chromosome partitioning ATPase
MSKNFELMRRAATHDFFNDVEGPTLVPEKAPVPAPVPAQKGPADPEIRKLVQRLFLHADTGKGPRLVSFSGIVDDDRSSWICASAGEALAEQADASVCLVDANLRSPRLHIHASADNQYGLADALTCRDPIQSFAIPLGGGNFWLIPSGSPTAGFYTSVERYRERIAELREAFDYVLISAPSLGHETEATLIGQLADGAVLIVEANSTRRETVRRAKEHLETAHVRLLGAVLDQRTFPIPEKLYRKL